MNDNNEKVIRHEDRKRFEALLQKAAGGNLNLLAVLYLQEQLGCGEPELIARYFDGNGNTAWLQALSREIYKTTNSNIHHVQERMLHELNRIPNLFHQVTYNNIASHYATAEDTKLGKSSSRAR